MNFKKKSRYHLKDTKCPTASERKKFLIKNGSILQEKLIGTFGARYKLPIHCFTAKEIINATDNFKEVVNPSFFSGSNYYMFDLIKGCFDQERRPVLVSKARQYYYPSSNRYYPNDPDEIIHNLVIISQMSHLKHVMKLVGCCLEFEIPLLVFEDTNNLTTLREFLYENGNLNVTRYTWRNRIKIIRDIVYTMAYLHNAFPTPIIHQTLGPNSVFIDQSSGNIPKFVDFSNCLSLPRGKMELHVSSMRGYLEFIDPEYLKTRTVTPKTDVYIIGVLMLVVVTGREVDVVCDAAGANTTIHVAEFVRDCLMKDQLNQVVVSEIWELDDRGPEKLEQLKGLLELAFRCTQEKRENRPYMADVAKELHKIEKMSPPI